MKLIVGLGNPGLKYVNTRHNLGFKVVEELSRNYGIIFTEKNRLAVYGCGIYKKEELLLAKPLTFVNQSGEAVKFLKEKYRISEEEVLVIVDDYNLPLGILRLKKKGSSGGHNGLESIISCLGTQNFPRLRLGIGAPTERDSKDYVLSRFLSEEEPVVKELVLRAGQSVNIILEQGWEEAMNGFNRKGKEKGRSICTEN